MKEFELYEPMRLWLQNYLEDRFKGCKIVTADTHSERLDRALRRYGMVCEQATGIDIEIDVLGIVENSSGKRLFFIEAKKTSLTLRDLGQLWAYCKLIDPEEAFLLTSADMGTLSKVLSIFKREDLLDFGSGKRIKKMKVGVWNLQTNTPNMLTLIPKIN